ncbi:MAG: hypothetical protein IPJ71_05600 [Bdellovibrionales bacterium]|nr:hypothetical protein [Bdellovibrionales bacterium]
MAQSKIVFFLCVFSYFVVACSQGYERHNNLGAPTGSVDSLSLNEPPTTSPEPQPPGGPGDSAGELNICSKLNFQGAEWPQTLSSRDRTAIGLAFNITGSFEGVVGWKNISNNFDGMGMSLGLFQQNFGQGTLQPLLINMRQESLSVLERSFKTQHLASLLKMIKSWESIPATFSSPSLWERELSPLDQDVDIRGDQGSSLFFLFASISPRNKESVDWALSNIYVNPNQLNEEWKLSFQSMAESPEYVTQQIGAALHLHDRAHSYMSEFMFRELRSYLFFLDIVVQNGGIPAPDRDEFKDWEKSHASAKEEQRLLKLLEIRLRRVRSQYREDVRSRKTAIIKGSGIVHKKKRDLPKEYCYKNLEMY